MAILDFISTIGQARNARWQAKVQFLQAQVQTSAEQVRIATGALERNIDHTRNIGSLRLALGTGGISGTSQRSTATKRLTYDNNRAILSDRTANLVAEAGLSAAGANYHISKNRYNSAISGAVIDFAATGFGAFNGGGGFNELFNPLYQKARNTGYQAPQVPTYTLPRLDNYLQRGYS